MMIEPDPVRDGNYLCYFTKVSPVKPQKEFLIPWSEPLRCFIISPGKNANGIISPSNSHYEKEGRKACTKGRGSDNVKKRLTGRGREDV
jgi:hypothetical protein